MYLRKMGSVSLLTGWSRDPPANRRDAHSDGEELGLALGLGLGLDLSRPQPILCGELLGPLRASRGVAVCATGAGLAAKPS
jgi:hypothetical protein